MCMPNMHIHVQIDKHGTIKCRVLKVKGTCVEDKGNVIIAVYDTHMLVFGDRLSPLKEKKVIDPQEIIKRGFILKTESDEVMADDMMIKARIITSDGAGEGIWMALLKAEDKSVCADDKDKGTEFYAVLANNSLAWEVPTWGRVLKVKTNGEERPVSYAAENSEKLKETHSAYMKEYVDKQG